MTSPIRKVSVAVLSWNGRQHLEVCLPALRAQQDPGVAWEVLVLDNGSEDDTRAWVSRQHPEVRLITSPHNLGFCAGNHRLVEAAEGDVIAFLNNDTRPRRDWLAALVAALREAPADVAAVSGQIVDWPGERLDFGRGIMTFDGHAFQLGFGHALKTAETPAAGEELLFACGGNMLIRRASFLAAGGFDESYFAYLEDVDLGWRLWAGGERIIFAPDAIVHHRSMATSAQLGNENRGLLFERNAFITAYKNYEEGLWQQIMPAILLTFIHRTQTLLVQNNPGGEQLTFDPYAGLIANTVRHRTAASEVAVAQELPAGEVPEELPTALPAMSLAEKWRAYGARDFFRRALWKAARLVLPRDPLAVAAHTPQLVDGRSVAQLRAVTYLLGNLDRAAASRRRVQARRKRSDREIFARFPLYLVPTYPGDERLFGSRAFQAWLPPEMPLVRAELGEIMRLR